MIGNDIIDLNLAKTQSSWQRPGFLQKLFNLEEQDFILHAENPEFNVWFFWSMKESVYKAVQRKYSLSRFFNPRLFSCNLLDMNAEKARGVVHFKNRGFETISNFSSNNIHTYTANSEFAMISGEKKSGSKLLQHISKHKNCPMESLNILKNKEGVPQLTYNGDNLQIPFSLSHHGNYSAYAFSLNLS